MRRDLLRKAMENIIPPMEFGASSSIGRGQGKTHGMETKTTILAVHYRDGILCAADRKMSSGYHIISQDTVKIHQVSLTSVLLGCGIVGQIQLIGDSLEHHCDSWRRSFDVPLSVFAQAKHVAQWCHWMSRNTADFSFGGILAGMDQDGSFKIYEGEEDGSRMRFDRFEANGSGGANAVIVLDNGWKPDLDCAAAQRLAVEALFHAANRDSGSSPIQIALPTIATVTKTGVASVPDAKVMEDVAQVLLDKMGIHVDLAKALTRAQRRRS